MIAQGSSIRAAGAPRARPSYGALHPHPLPTRPLVLLLARPQQQGCPDPMARAADAKDTSSATTSTTPTASTSRPAAIASTAAAAAALVLVAAAALAPLPARAADDGGGASQQAAAQTFALKCAGCHAGGGNILQAGATLSTADLERNGYGDPDALFRIIYGGKGRMPGFGADCAPRGQCTFGARLSDAEVRDVAEFVLRRAGEGWAGGQE